MSLLSDYGGPHFPNVKFRPGARTTTPWGHDVDPVKGGYRFHRAVDRAGGTGVVICPFKADTASIEYNLIEYGSLVRLFFAGWELRIAHMEVFNPAFLNLVEGKCEIPDGLVIGQEGNLGKSTGKHTHTEVVSYGRIEDLDEILLANGIVPGLKWDLHEQKTDTKENYPQLHSWKKGFAVQTLGPYESAAWDRRSGDFAIWYDSKALFGF